MARARTSPRAARRSHRFGTAATLLAVVLAALAWGLSPDQGPLPAPVPSPGSSDGGPVLACPIPAPGTAADYESMFAHAPGGWRCADGAISVGLADGRRLWLFGDTVSTSRATVTMQGNSAFVQDNGCLTRIDGTQDVLPPVTSDTSWPTSAILDGGVVWVFAQQIARTDRAALGFEQSGTVLFAVAVRGDDLDVVDTVRLPSTDSRTDTVPQWGAAVAAGGGWVFVYGTARDPRPLVFGRDVYVARVRSGHLDSVVDWRYWDGRRWSVDARSAVPVAFAPGGVSNAFTADVAAGGATTWVSKADDFVGDWVTVWTAPSPTGPFTPRDACRAPSTPDLLQYLPTAHPEVLLLSGRVLVTISRNTMDFRELMAHPRRFAPRFVEIPWPGTGLG